MKYRIVSAGLMIVILGWVNPAIAQFRRDRPDFYEEGQQQMEREIERLNKKPPENLLTIQGEGQQWEEFTLMDGGFTVWMPGVPTEETQSLETPAGAINLKGFATNQASSRFVVAYGDYPQTAEIGNPEAILATVRDRILKEIEATAVKSDRPISINNSPGKELTLQNSNISVTLRLYLVNNRLYVLGASQQNPGSRTEDIAKFLDSFRLLPQPTSEQLTSPVTK